MYLHFRSPAGSRAVPAMWQPVSAGKEFEVRNATGLSEQQEDRRRGREAEAWQEKGCSGRGPNREMRLFPACCNTGRGGLIYPYVSPGRTITGALCAFILEQ